jgi:hypothetical protein
MNARTVLIPLLCVGAIALACGPRAHSQASLVSLNLANRPTASRQQQKPARKKESSVTKITPSFTVQVDGDALQFSLEVTNVGKKNVELTFPDGQTHDFAVLDSIGREVYRWSTTRMFTQSVQNRTIEDGETLRIAERATTSLPHGSYVAVATLRSTNFPVQEKVAFELK